MVSPSKIRSGCFEVSYFPFIKVPLVDVASVRKYALSVREYVKYAWSLEIALLRRTTSLFGVRPTLIMPSKLAVVRFVSGWT